MTRLSRTARFPRIVISRALPARHADLTEDYRPGPI